MHQYAAGQPADPREPEKFKRSLSAVACAAGLSPGRPCRIWGAGPTGHDAGRCHPLAIVASWLRPKRWPLSPPVQPPPTDLSSDRPRRGNHHDRPATHDHGSNDIGITSQNWPFCAAPQRANSLSMATHTRRSDSLDCAEELPGRLRAVTVRAGQNGGSVQSSSSSWSGPSRQARARARRPRTPPRDEPVRRPQLATRLPGASGPRPGRPGAAGVRFASLTVESGEGPPAEPEDLRLAWALRLGWACGGGG